MDSEVLIKTFEMVAKYRNRMDEKAYTEEEFDLVDDMLLHLGEEIVNQGLENKAMEVLALNVELQLSEMSEAEEYE